MPMPILVRISEQSTEQICARCRVAKLLLIHKTLTPLSESSVFQVDQHNFPPRGTDGCLLPVFLLFLPQEHEACRELPTVNHERVNFNVYPRAQRALCRALIAAGCAPTSADLIFACLIRGAVESPSHLRGRRA
jgi:hypothetical protein